MAIAAFVLVALAAVAGVRLSGMAITEPDAVPLVSRQLVFTDAADGSILVQDARSGQPIDRLTGEHGLRARHAARPGPRAAAARASARSRRSSWSRGPTAG